MKVPPEKEKKIKQYAQPCANTLRPDLHKDYYSSLHVMKENLVRIFANISSTRTSAKRTVGIFERD